MLNGSWPQDVARCCKRMQATEISLRFFPLKWDCHAVPWCRDWAFSGLPSDSMVAQSCWHTAPRSSSARCAVETLSLLKNIHIYHIISYLKIVSSLYDVIWCETMWYDVIYSRYVLHVFSIPYVFVLLVRPEISSTGAALNCGGRFSLGKTKGTSPLHSLRRSAWAMACVQRSIDQKRCHCNIL